MEHHMIQYLRRLGQGKVFYMKMKRIASGIGRCPYRSPFSLWLCWPLEESGGPAILCDITISQMCLRIFPSNLLVLQTVFSGSMGMTMFSF